MGPWVSRSVAPGPLLGAFLGQQSPGDLLRFGRLLAAGKSPSDFEVAKSQRCVSTDRVVFNVRSAFLFGQNGPGTLEVCRISTRLCVISGRFCRRGAPPGREAHILPLGLSLGASRDPFGASRGSKGGHVEYRLCVAVWPNMMEAAKKPQP